MTTPPNGLAALDREMARQSQDALASFAAAQGTAARIAAQIRQDGRLLLLGMGGSHAVGRMVAPHYRDLGIEAIALPLSEQLAAPLALAGWTVLITSQSGESAEVLRFLTETPPGTATFGLTLDGAATLARTVPCLVGEGGLETAFAATRSLTITLAQHLAILAALGADPTAALNMLRAPPAPPVAGAAATLAWVHGIVTIGRGLCGLAEAIALGLAELGRLPAFALEGGQFRHGPVEMLGANLGVVFFQGLDPQAPPLAPLIETAIAAGSPVVVFDASGAPLPAGCCAITVPPAAGLAALFALLPAAQRFMIAIAAPRVPDVGLPRRSSKITRTE